MKRRFILSLAVLFLSLCAFAQSAVVGSVVDKNGEPVTGAAVIAVVNGAKVGAVADFDGKFSISVPKGTSLEFSALGFKTISVPAASGMTVVLEEDIDQLEETVIIGYGSVKKKDLLGSVSTVRQQSLIDRKSSGVVSSMQGLVSGVNITSSGQPGSGASIKIRGIGSFTGYVFRR